MQDIPALLRPCDMRRHERSKQRRNGWMQAQAEASTARATLASYLATPSDSRSTQKRAEKSHADA